MTPNQEAILKDVIDKTKLALLKWTSGNYPVDFMCHLNIQPYPYPTTFFAIAQMCCQNGDVVNHFYVIKKGIGEVMGGDKYIVQLICPKSTVPEDFELLQQLWNVVKDNHTTIDGRSNYETEEEIIKELNGMYK